MIIKLVKIGKKLFMFLVSEFGELIVYLFKFKVV